MRRALIPPKVSLDKPALRGASGLGDAAGEGAACGAVSAFLGAFGEGEAAGEGVWPKARPAQKSVRQEADRRVIIGSKR
jgi:hypothetical protein